MSSNSIRALTTAELDLVSGGTDFAVRDWTPGGGSYQPRLASAMIRDLAIQGAVSGGAGSKKGGQQKQ